MTARMYKMVFAPGEDFFTGHTPATTVEVPVPDELVCQGCEQMVAVASMLEQGFCKKCRTSTRWTVVYENDYVRVSKLPDHSGCNDSNCGHNKVGV